jgi:hypothetical protein
MTKTRWLITGAAQGIGKAIALEAARKGAEHVCLADRDAGLARSVADEVRALGAEATVVEVDLRHAEQVEQMVQAAVETMIGLDTLVNNAGVIEGAVQPGATFESLSEATWDTVVDINLKAMWLAIKYAAPALRRSDRHPSVINAASVSGMSLAEIQQGENRLSRILLPAISDVWISYCVGRYVSWRLLDAGVRVFEYQPRTVHAKTLLVDGDWASIGTANFNHRSLFHDYEINFVTDDGDICAAMEAQFQADLQASNELVSERLEQQWPWWERLVGYLGWWIRWWL